MIKRYLLKIAIAATFFLPYNICRIFKENQGYSLHDVVAKQLETVIDIHYISYLIYNRIV